jgi:hypothetical protein
VKFTIPKRQLDVGAWRGNLHPIFGARSQLP